MEDAGSIYCGNWQVQSGNHPNPVVSFDAGNAGYGHAGSRYLSLQQ